MFSFLNLYTASIYDSEIRKEKENLKKKNKDAVLYRIAFMKQLLHKCDKPLSHREEARKQNG